MELTKEDLKNILALIANASITGKDAMTVAMLTQKITNLINQPEVEDPKAEEVTKEK